ncbi:MAG: SpoIID/LytB domain-containing protein [Candidatus Gastranaerophilales bacterium]|nr:SpoIID/LytB domain-containing protein [Candidatus Gastranaerophilales bacterium]
MKHLFLKILFVFIILFNISPKADAIKIGLQIDVSEMTAGVSVKGVVTDKLTGNPICSLDAMQSYRLKATKDGIDIFIDGKKYNLGSRFVTISPIDSGFVSTKGRWYRGSLLVVNRFGKLTVINDVKLEDYLLGVVPCEMPSGWNEEALKAQAIAARSYAVANIGKNASKGFDLKDTTDDQVYGGASSETNKTNQIVAQTFGIVITQDKQVVTAFYSASAGGKTGVTGKDLPYLHSVPSYDDNVKKMGHGLGMSQHGANNLAKQGYNAYQILAYYYHNIKFGKLSEKWNM